ncbi:MAG: Fe-S cluster assembly protein SufD [Candidatus Sumerlaeota bacterium]|nr:Fe-S cluster assembly protein SufD [Candidatus Sumerlaeota bacterium]
MTASPLTTPLVGKEQFLAEFERAESAFADNGRGWLQPIRREAIHRFAQMGFPTRRNEQWRHTNLAALESQAFRRAPDVSLNEEIVAFARSFLLAEPGALQIVFVNGNFAPELSSLAASDGVRVSPLAMAMLDEGELIRRHLARHARLDERPFVALNTAFLRDGAFVHIPKERRLDAPIHLLFVSTSAAEPFVTHPRNLLIADEGAEAKIVETYAGLSGAAYFTNATTELVVGPAANVEHYKLQFESPAAFHLATIQVRQERASRFASHTLSTGGLLARNDINVALAGEGCEGALHGLYLGAGKQHLDSHTLLEHASPRCSSREVYKGILDGESSAVFNGCIQVHPHAQKTDALQSNKCLLLSDAAAIHTQPQLKIYADDVKCTHGASVGRLDQSALHYLRSRGIAEAEARALMIYAFANEVIDGFRIDSLRERLGRRIVERFQRNGV